MISTIISPQKVKSIHLDKNNDSLTVPNSVFNKTFHSLLYGEVANLVINTKDKNGQCYWVFSAYSKDKNNEVNTVFSEILMDCKKLKQIKALYQKLNKIEKNVSITVAEKYLEGFLEYNNVSLNDLVSYYSLTA